MTHPQPVGGSTEQTPDLRSWVPKQPIVGAVTVCDRLMTAAR